MSKVTLTPQQVEARKLFRASVIRHIMHQKDKHMMFNVIRDVAEPLGIPYDEAKDLLLSIPSIGWTKGNMPILVWLAKYYRPISTAFWAGADEAHLMGLWKVTKRTSDMTPKRPHADKRDLGRDSKLRRTMAGIKRFKEAMPEIKGRHTWHACK